MTLDVSCVRSDGALPAGSPTSRPMTVRGRLLLSVNLVLAVLLAVLAAVDYRRGLDAAVNDRLAALDEEAAAIHAAVVHLRDGHGPDAARSYIEGVCRRRCERNAPWHRIEAEWPGTVLRARRGEANAEALSATLRSAAAESGRRVRFGRRDVVVGWAGGEGTAVYVAEATDDIRRAVRADVLIGLTVLCGLGVVAAGVVNVVLLGAVVRPLERLAQAVRRIGEGQLGAVVAAAESRETHVLAEAVTRMSRSLADADRDRRRRMDQARRLQEHLLPRDEPLPGLAYSYLFRPADEVAGDYFDLIRLTDGGVLIALADVTGHGVPAALGAAMLKTLLMQAAERPDARPGETLEFVNGRFAAVSLPGNFASVFLARWRPGSASLEYASAGHEPAILKSAGGISELRSTGMLLGIQDGARWDTESVAVPKGARLVLYTDGLVEAVGIREGRTARERLKRAIAASEGATLDRFVVRLGEEFAPREEGAKPADDVTVLAIEFCDVGPVVLPLPEKRSKAC